jgi:hypothetical protein
MIENVQTSQRSPKDRHDITNCWTGCSLHGRQNL